MSSGVVIWLLTRMRDDEAVGVAALLGVAILIYLVQWAYRKAVNRR